MAASVWRHVALQVRPHAARLATHEAAYEVQALEQGGEGVQLHGGLREKEDSRDVFKHKKKSATRMNNNYKSILHLKWHSNMIRYIFRILLFVLSI